MEVKTAAQMFDLEDFANSLWHKSLEVSEIKIADRLIRIGYPVFRDFVFQQFGDMPFHLFKSHAHGLGYDYLKALDGRMIPTT